VFILQVKENEEVDSYNTRVIIDLLFNSKSSSAEIGKRNLLFYLAGKGGGILVELQGS
jgi:hypothetical protein